MQQLYSSQSCRTAKMCLFLSRVSALPWCNVRTQRVKAPFRGRERKIQKEKERKIERHYTHSVQLVRHLHQLLVHLNPNFFTLQYKEKWVTDISWSLNWVTFIRRCVKRLLLFKGPCSGKVANCPRSTPSFQSIMSSEPPKMTHWTFKSVYHHSTNNIKMRKKWVSNNHHLIKK